MRGNWIVAGTALVCAAAGAAILGGVRFVESTHASGPDVPDLADLPRAPGVRIVSAFGSGPARFEPNLGQAPADVRWIRRGPGHVTLVTDTGFSTVARTERAAAADGPLGAPAPATATTVRFRFGGGDVASAATPEGALASRTHYFVGHDASRWVRDVPNYERVRLSSVWPGVDVVLHGRDGRLEYDFLVAPGGDAGRIALDVEGADALRVDEAGDLVAEAGAVVVRHRRPVVWQDLPQGRRRLACSYEIEDGSRVRFRVADRDAAHALVIDPVEEVSVGGAVVGDPRSSHLESPLVAFRIGGAQNEDGTAISAGPDGTFGLGGRTQSIGFPTVPVTSTPFGPFAGGSEAFAGVFEPDGTPRYVAFFGSAAHDGLADLRVAPDGSLFAVGWTSDGASFPQRLAFQTAGFGGYDAFALRILPSGDELAYSGAFGGASTDIFTSIALPPESGTATLTATVGLMTDSPSLPFLGSSPGGGDAALLRLDAAGAPVAGLHLGGAGNDLGAPVRVEFAASGKLAASFATRDRTFQVSPDAFQTVHDAHIGGTSAYTGVVVIVPDALTGVERSTLLTSTASFVPSALVVLPDEGIGVVARLGLNASVTTTANAAQPDIVGLSPGAYVALTSDLREASTVSYVGAGDSTFVTGIIAVSTPAVPAGEVFIAGRASAGVDPIGGEAHHGGSFDGFVAQAPAHGGPISFRGFFGGAASENIDSTVSSPTFFVQVGRPVTVLDDGSVVLIGQTISSSEQWPGLAGTAGGGFDAFAVPVTLTAVASTGPEPVPLAGFRVLKGTLTDSPRPLRDRVYFKYSFDPAAAADAIEFAPGFEGSFAASLRTAQTATATIMTGLADVRVPLDTTGWTAKRKGELVVYKSPRGETPSVSISVDLRRGSGTFTLAKTDLPFAPDEFPAIVAVELANGSGDDEVFLDEGRTGAFRFAPPLTGITGQILVSPTTFDLGQSFTAVGRIRNHAVTATSSAVEILHMGFPVAMRTVSVPGRNPVTLLPGIATVVGSGTPPNVGNKQKIELIADGDVLARSAVTVKKPKPSSTAK